MNSSDIWLIGPVPGPDGQSRLQWLTPLERGHCPFAAPCGDLRQLPALRDRARQASIEDCWPVPLVAALRSMLRAARSGLVRVRIAVHATEAGNHTAAVRDWQRGLFEHLSLDGQPLPDRVLIEREAPRQYDGLPVASGDALVLNTWFGAKKGEPEQVVPRVASGVQLRNGYRSVAGELHTNRNLNALSALAVIAHGACDATTEHPAHDPFLARRDLRDASTEVSWSLPECTLPPLIVILACSSDRLELADYGSRLLGRGARCVLVPSGRIDATAAAGFVTDFLNRWYQGRAVAEVLHSLRDTYWTNLLDRLWILGSGELRHEATPGTASVDWLNQLPTDDLTDLLEEPETSRLATAALADRGTLRAFQSGEGPRPAISLLSESLRYERSTDSDQKGRAFLARLDAAYELCSRPTREWLANFLMGLGERFDHDTMERYRGVPERATNSTFGTAMLVRFCAVADARVGHYVRSAQSLAQGFEILRGLGEDSPLDRLELAGTVVNHLIDVNLPGSADLLSKRIRRDLDALNRDDADVLEFKLQDRFARIAFRQGDIETALVRMQGKRATAMRGGEPVFRELAWLVYLAAWRTGAPRQTHWQWVNKAIAAVRALETDCESDPAGQLAGNSHLSYLLRALSAWHWARPEETLGRLLSAWIDRAIDQIQRPNADPGPWAFLLAYLAAAGSDEAAREWPTARAHLLDKEYRLETLGLECLWGLRRDDHAAILGESQQIRSSLIDILRPALVSSGMIEPSAANLLATELADRDRAEHELLASPPVDAGERRIALLQSGLAPL